MTAWCYSRLPYQTASLTHMTRAARTSPSITAPAKQHRQPSRQPRTRGIHLVAAGMGDIQPNQYSPILGQAWLRQQQAREARRLRLGAMALGAAFAPALWLGHELLVRLHLI